MAAGWTTGRRIMRRVYIVRLAITGLALLNFGCASHRAVTCPKPAKVVGTNSLNSQGGWVLVREDRSTEDTAARIAAAYHVRTQSLTYVHGFNTYPVPDDPKFLCDKAVVEVHYAAPQAAPGR
jgi:hypothetical protein